MIEPEIAFADLSDDATLAEALLKHIFSAVLDKRADDMAFFEERIEKGVIAKLQGIVDTEFVRMDYGEAIRILGTAKEKFDFPVQWGMDLQSEHERYLSEKHVGKPVILMNYPKEIKAFYMRLNDDGKTVAAMDVLAPGIGEIIGGSQREERLDVLDARMTEAKLDKDHYGWYRDLRRYGTVPHAGFGLGFERTVAYVTGLSNVRDAIPFPRTPGNARYLTDRSPPQRIDCCSAAARRPTSFSLDENLPVFFAHRRACYKPEGEEPNEAAAIDLARDRCIERARGTSRAVAGADRRPRKRRQCSFALSVQR